MKLKDRLVSEGMRLATDPRIAKLMQDERFMRLVMTAMSVPGRVQSFTEEQKETIAKTLGLATEQEVKDLKRVVASLEEQVATLSRKR